jgi:hypothetical protein
VLLLHPPSALGLEEGGQAVGGGLQGGQDGGLVVRIPGPALAVVEEVIHPGIHDIGDVLEEAAQRQSLAVGLPGQHLLGNALQEVDRPPPDLAEVLEDLAVGRVHGHNRLVASGRRLRF